MKKSTFQQKFRGTPKECSRNTIIPRNAGRAKLCTAFLFVPSLPLHFFHSISFSLLSSLLIFFLVFFFVLSPDAPFRVLDAFVTSDYLAVVTSLHYFSHSRFYSTGARVSRIVSHCILRPPPPPPLSLSSSFSFDFIINALLHRIAKRACDARFNAGYFCFPNVKLITARHSRS